MNLGEVAKASAESMSSRFFRTGYLPTYAGLLFLLVLIWAGAPGGPLSFDRAWRTAANLGVAEVLLITLAVTLLAVMFQPLQLILVRALEGAWPGGLGTGLGRAWQLHRRRILQERAELPAAESHNTATNVAAPPAAPPADVFVQTAGVAGARLRLRYPLPDHLVRPTALGNALAAMESTAGRGYGWDAVVAWPRLYPVLGERVRALVDDRRDTLDGAARLCATAGVVAPIAAGLLVRSGWWLLLALVPVIVSVLSYVGAVQAAMAYGEAVQTAFDLHRFDLLRALHLPLPVDRAQERVQAKAVCDWWRQGIPDRPKYEHVATNAVAGTGVGSAG